MSFSLLRVPKRAALTALRGLVVGTSCTLFLILEDQRRRIIQANSVIQNAEKIRSAKQYRTAHSPLNEQPSTTELWHEDCIPAATAIESTIRLQKDQDRDYRDLPESVHMTHGQPKYAAAVLRPDESSTGRKSLENAQHNSQEVQNEAVSTHRSAPNRKHPPRAWGTSTNIYNNQISPALFSRPVPVNANPTALPGLDHFPQNSANTEDQIIGQIREAVILGDTLSLENAVKALKIIGEGKDLTTEQRTNLTQAIGSLCRKCQHVELMDQAARALCSLVKLSPVIETDYYACNPQPVIDYAISAAETGAQVVKTKGEKIKKVDRLAAEEKLDLALALIMPKFSTGTLSASRVAGWIPIAEKVMRLAFDLGRIQEASSVFWRIQHYGGDPKGLVIVRYMEYLADKERFARIVNTFNLLRRRLTELDKDTWYKIGDAVADAVNSAIKQDPVKVLKRMVESCLADRSVRTTWATKLLYCHWKRGQSFADTLAFFEQFEELGGCKKVRHSDGVYRVMIQIAMEAEQWQNMDDFYAKLQVIRPSSNKDARILGLFALAKSKMGDWTGVWEEFEKMEVKDRIDTVFIPVLKEFMATHTIGETEDFLRPFIQELQIPVSPYMVTLVAHGYGAIRDIQSLVDWLDYCSTQGFVVDAAFSNAIIVNCKRRWDFDFGSLKLVYRTLLALSPNFGDQVTHNNMVSAGLTAHRRAHPLFTRKQVTSLGIKFNKHSRSSDPHTVRLDLRRAFATHEYKLVQNIYDVANERGVALDEHHLLIAVKAAIKNDGHTENAMKMIIEARGNGLDVSRAATPVFLPHVHQIFSGETSDKDELLRQVQKLIARFQDSGIQLSHSALMRVGHLFLKVRHFEGAISYGMSALQLRRMSYPDDISSFQLFIQAYAMRADTHGMKWTIAGAYSSQFYHKNTVFKALKDAHQLLLNQPQSSDVKQALNVVEQGLDRARLRRLKIVEERMELERSTIDIMKRAALEAEQQPQDEETLKRRNEILWQMEEKIRREEEEALEKAAKRLAQVQERKNAAIEHEIQMRGSEEVAAMERILMEQKHEVYGGF